MKISNHHLKFFIHPSSVIITLFILLSVAPKALALSLGPLKLKTAYGKLRVVNTSERFEKINFVVYPAKINNGNAEIITEFDEQKLNSTVKLTPSTVRMSGLSERSVNYSINDQKGNYFLCAENKPNAQYMLRICALWTSL
jgi:hypothetical protein